MLSKNQGPPAKNQGRDYSMSSEFPSQVIKDVSRICAGLRHTESLLDQANVHLEDEAFSEGTADLQLAFSELAPLPLRICGLVDRCQAVSSTLAPGSEEPNEFAIANPICSFETPHIFSCRVMAPPFLRDQRNAKFYASRLGLEVERSVVASLAERDHRFRKLFAIFVNYMGPSWEGSQPYYDNDNLLIKRMLDAIISFVGVDDAARYCTNLYSYAEGEAPSFAIFVVEQGYLFEWAETHPEVFLAKELLQKA